MLKTFRHKGLKAFFETGSRAGIQAVHAPRLERILGLLNAASTPKDMDLPGYRFHSLTGPLAGQWSVRVSGNWRVIFAFDGNGDAILVDYLDYH